MTEPVPARATDAQRQAVARQLSQALSTGQLSLPEFDERTALAYSAVTTGDLDKLTRDLAPKPAETGAGRGRSVALLSETTLKNWRVPATHTSVSVLGDITLDLRSATWETDVITINCYSVLGDLNLIVPPDVEVQSGGIAILGEFNVEGGRPPHPTAPARRVVKVGGFSVLAEVNVRVVYGN
ncbi:hypothetical protein CPHO_09600 [Corynebacterium phocae]|uniref:Uncharacterized protein n=1 Tax=Corynebacterium phocae TaxID=161895 RepID=A0A1L7D4Q1_9CORY|nr:DUF1707 domain-containing protein [Corynebacterium phocae]APT93100.1 hypothetical protein CPHO_09600 [Corynebacterium phocae]KAA8722403.1 DUF1707 domain-containing protein [Corynebacterium phocae]